MYAKIVNRIAGVKEDYRLRNLSRPSFRRRLAERKRVADRVRALRGIGDEPIYQIETKIGHKRIAEKCGVRTASVLQGPVDSISEFDLEALPSKFVLKPIVGSGVNGIFFLRKQEDGLLNILTGDAYPNDLAVLRKAGLDRFDGVPLITEELLELDGSPTMNWKVFAFYGEVAFIRQIDEVGFFGQRNLDKPDKRYKFWSPDGQDLGKIDGHDARYDSSLPPPKDMAGILEAAKKISIGITTPFVRVDLYEADEGVYFGEATLRPGSLWKRKASSLFNPEWDEKLGIMWEEAEARLIESVDEVYIP
ncbi:ATP-grasp fold amidoligase family protein [Shimia sp. W99]